MNGTTDKTRTRGATGHGPATTANDALDKRILRLSDAGPIRSLREDFAEQGIPMELIRGDEAPVGLRGRRPQVFVDAKGRRSLCIVVNDESTEVHEVVYVAAEALATAYGFPRDPGDLVHEALVNSFALTFVTNSCGPAQARRSFQIQLARLQRARLRGEVDDQLRQTVALRCWAIGTALDPEDREVFLGQVDITDEGTAELVVGLTRAWGTRSPSSGVEAAEMLAVVPF